MRPLALVAALALLSLGCAHLRPCADLDCRQAGAECAPGWECERDQSQVSQYHCVRMKYGPLPDKSEAGQ